MTQCSRAATIISNVHYIVECLSQENHPPVCQYRAPCHMLLPALTSQLRNHLKFFDTKHIIQESHASWHHSAENKVGVCVWVVIIICILLICPRMLEMKKWCGQLSTNSMSILLETISCYSHDVDIPWCFFTYDMSHIYAALQYSFGVFK